MRRALVALAVALSGLLAPSARAQSFPAWPLVSLPELRQPGLGAPRGGTELDGGDFLWDMGDGKDEDDAAVESAGGERARSAVRLAAIHAGLGLYVGPEQTTSTLVGDFTVTLGDHWFTQVIAGVAGSETPEDVRARGGNPTLLLGYGAADGSLSYALYGGASIPLAVGGEPENLALYATASGMDISRVYLWGPDSWVVGGGGRLAYRFGEDTEVFQTALPGVALSTAGQDPLAFLFHTTGLEQHLAGPMDLSLQVHGQFVNTEPSIVYAFAAEVGLYFTFGHHRFGPRFSLPINDPYGFGSGDLWGLHLDYTLIDPGNL